MKKTLIVITAILSVSLVSAEWLFTVGQTGRKIDGTIGVGIEERG